MAIGINDLDDDDDVIASNQIEEPTVVEPVIQNDNDDSLISDFLKTKGIEDYSKIKFEDDEGDIIERNWDDLSREEKFNILNTPTTTAQPVNENDNDLSDDEINLLNQIRETGLSPEQFIQNIIQNNQQPQEPQYKIDDLSDDEVYILDLESRVGELTDEEAAQALVNAKQNEEFYTKQVEGIRKEYKEREDFQNQQEQASLEEQQQQAFQEYQEKIINAINGFDSIGNLDLNFEDKDKEELAEFMLSQDEKGVNYLYQALQDPETLTRVAWFILNGEEAFNNVSDYFTNQIKLVSENQYKKGLEDGKKGTSSKLFIDNSKKNNKTVHRSYTSINDLDDEE